MDINNCKDIIRDLIDKAENLCSELEGEGEYAHYEDEIDAMRNAINEAEEKMEGEE